MRFSSLPPKPGFVYFIKADCTPPAVKVGFCSNVAERLSRLQTGCPVDLEIMGLISCSDAPEREREVHIKFSHLHRRGEWFNLDKDLLAFIKRESQLTERLAGLAAKHGVTGRWPADRLEALDAPAARRKASSARAVADERESRRRVELEGRVSDCAELIASRPIGKMRGRTIREKIASYKADRGLTA